MQPLAFGLDLALIALVAGLLGLDRRGAFQFMLGQPVVAVPLLGLLLGQVEVGLQLGALLQLLWMSSSLFGANVPPNEMVASLSIAGMVFLTERHGGGLPLPSLVAAAILLGAPLSLAGRAFEIRNDSANALLAARADEAARLGEWTTLARLPWVALARAFLINAGLVMLAVGLGFALLLALTPALLPVAPRSALAVIATYVVPAVGIGVALSHLRRRRGLALAALAFVVLLLVQPGGPT